MDDRLLRERLKQAKTHAARGEKSLARQRRVVAELEQRGADASQAKALLATFETLQARFSAECDELRRELGAQAERNSRPDPGK